MTERTGALHKKKLIEVALPLAEINAASAREKSIRHGHPSTLHLWWARRPLAACRAVLFASLVDDPASDPAFADKSEPEQAIERERLHDIIRELVIWENSNNPEVLERARAEIRRCVGDNPPPVLDPFCGGGSIPLEAQRLGLEAHASDLNPVAVLITKALIEIPPKFAGMQPVNPEGHRQIDEWPAAAGLANDVRYYGKWMRDEAEKRIGHLYPKAALPPELGGGEATVIAWLWARTVTCPNPACGATMPLVRSLALSTRKGKETWVEPVVDHSSKQVAFTIEQTGGAMEGTVNRGGATCVACGTAVPFSYIRAQGKAGAMGQQLMAIVAEGNRRRIYLPPIDEHAAVARVQDDFWKPDGTISHWPGRTNVVEYGLTTFGDLFTDRQLVALTTFSDLVGEARERVRQDAVAAGLPDDGAALAGGGKGAQAYADAVTTYLGLTVSRLANTHCTIALWSPSRDQTKNAFARQAIPMTWDFAEANPFASAAGDLEETTASIGKLLECLEPGLPAVALQNSATEVVASDRPYAVSSDPPYYDNVGYADLSDFFYVWMRRSLRAIYPDLFRTVLVPKADELIASPYRHGGSKSEAEEFFEKGLGQAFRHMCAVQRSDMPLTLFYAFKQREADGDETADSMGSNGSVSTGWETMLEGLVASGLSVVATWPMRTERGARSISIGTNALASSIVLACRPRSEDAPIATRREFVDALRRELDTELAVLLEANIAPVDLAQSMIGPGLAIFTRYSQVLEADGTPMSIRTALGLINEVLDQILQGRDERLDKDTRFCVDWYSQFGYASGPYGQADVLARAKGVSVEGLQRSGVLEGRGGKVRILKRSELPSDWDPAEDDRVPVWEALQHLIVRLEQFGIDGAGELLARVGDERGELSKQLAVRLYELCDRKRWTTDARSYNEFARDFPDIQRAMQEDGARYDAYVREYPQIQEASRKFKIGYEQEVLM